MLVSIIIPVYNVAKYIKRCLLSCVFQAYSSAEYEIIVINDGTQDNSMDIVNDIRLKYSHLIRVYSQTNQGLSAARNAGLDLANGKYVWFVDSDDWIEPDSLQKIIPALIENGGIDLLQIQYRFVYDDISLNRNAAKFLIDGFLSGREVIRMRGLPTPAQFTICRKAFLDENKLRFILGIYHEDSEFKPRVTYLANCIMSLDVVCYNYYQRQTGSITSKFRLKNANDIVVVVNRLYDFSSSIPICYRHYIYKFMGMNMNSLFYGAQNLSKEENVLVKIQLCKQKKIFRSMCLSMNLKYFIEGILFYFNINLGMWLYKHIR